MHDVVEKSDFWKFFEQIDLGGRKDTFRKMFERLDGIDRFVSIIETGCVRKTPDAEAYRNDGCSTVLFDRYLAGRKHGGCLRSFDINPDAVNLAQTLMVGENSGVFWLDSIEALTAFKIDLDAGHLPLDLLYLDSFDYTTGDAIASGVHHYRELMAAMHIIGPETLVVVDDSPGFIDDMQRTDIGGKGAIIAKHMIKCGASLEFCSYQSGWTGVGPIPKTAEEPEQLVDLVERARANFEINRVLQCENLYRRILEITTPPESGRARVAHGEACAFYARLALAKQKHGQAADWYREALKADPLATDYRLKLVLDCFMPMGATLAAQTEAERATRISPDYPEAWHVLGGVYHEMGEAAKCIAAYDKQLELIPDDASAKLDRATIALDTSDLEFVKELCEGVLETDRRPDALHCLAMVAAREHDHERAVELYDEAIEGECRDIPVTQWNKSISLHAIGRYAEGWKAHEARQGQKTNPALYLPMTRFTLPRWQGEPSAKPDGSRVSIHVHAEAGAGDNLALVRYLRVLWQLGYEVRYEAADGLYDLAVSSFPNVKVMRRAPDYPGALGIEPFDYHSPVGSLPAVLGTTLESIPWFGPYLHPDPAKVAVWRARLAGLMKGRESVGRVGVCWSSGIRPGIWMTEYGLRKSMNFGQGFGAMLMDASSCTYDAPLFFNLQVGPERMQQSDVVIDLLPERPSWEDTAALIANLDLVITVDTAVAHLAGAMGKDVWVMSQRDAASWHFMCWRPGAPWNEASPWYPSARVFRQHEFDRPHYWRDVIQDVRKALDTWVRLRRSEAVI